MRFTDKNGTVNKVINYSYNYTISLIINLVKSVYQSTDIVYKIKLKLWVSVGKQIMGRFVTSLKLPGTGA